MVRGWRGKATPRSVREEREAPDLPTRVPASPVWPQTPAAPAIRPEEAACSAVCRAMLTAQLTSRGARLPSRRPPTARPAGTGVRLAWCAKRCPAYVRRGPATVVASTCPTMRTIAARATPAAPQGARVENVFARVPIRPTSSRTVDLTGMPADGRTTVTPGWESLGGRTTLPGAPAPGRWSSPTSGQRRAQCTRSAAVA